LGSEILFAKQSGGSAVLMGGDCGFSDRFK